LVAVALVASGVAPVAGGAPSPSSSPSLDADPSAATPSVINPSTVNPSIVEQIDEPFDPNTATRIRIEPTSDGDAQWTVSVRYALSDERDRAAFDSVGERFRDGEVGPDATLFEGFARQASQNLDRTMRIENVDRELVTHDDPSSFDVASAETAAVGELRLTFVWTEFLEEDGENLVLGDALTTSDGGTWLLSLEDRQTLEVATPEGYSVTGTPSTAVAQLSDGDVIIEGPQTFEGGDPVVIVYGPASTIAPPWTMLTAAIVIAAVLIAGSIVGYRRMDGSPGSAASGSVDEATVDSGGGERTDHGRLDAVTGDPTDPNSASNGSGADGGEAAAEEEAEAEDLSLLSDEERVERLLEDNGGRMRQADIVAKTGWSDAKVSQLLSAMAELGRVEKLRLGRENLISIPDDGGAPDGDNGESSESEA